MLDPVSPDHFHPAFAGALEHLRHSGGLSGFTCLGCHVLIALDGTEYHRSDKVHCPQCWFSRTLRGANPPDLNGRWLISLQKERLPIWLCEA